LKRFSGDRAAEALARRTAGYVLAEEVRYNASLPPGTVRGCASMIGT
jgi:hypothetical protein